MSCFGPDSPQKVLWEQQIKQAKLKNNKGMRWHPVMIRWCISIFIKSPGTYDHLKNSGFLMLPSRKTLEKYVNFTEPTTGVNPDVLEHLLHEIKNVECEEKHVGIIHDEMKSGIVYNKHTGKIVGFTDLGDVNNELEEFALRCSNKDIEHRPIATHVLTLMVRGINFHLSYPLSYYAGTSFKGHQLFPVL